MKLKSLSLAIFLFSFASWTVGQTISVRGSDAQAQVSPHIEGKGASLLVLKGADVNGNPITLLRFTIINKTPNPDGTVTMVMGFGLIPNDAFVAQGPSRMILSVDTSQQTSFENEVCIVTLPPHLNFNCSPGQGGFVQVTWTGNGINSEASTEHSDTTTGPITEHMDGHGTSTSADAQGSILGLEFSKTGSAFDAFISSNHTHNVTITHN
jgi:hypothetical protein